HLIFVEDKKDAQTKSLDSVKPELAQLAIQKTKSQDLDKLLTNTAEDIQKALQSGNFAAAEKIANKVDGQVFKNSEINLFDQKLGTSSLAPQEVDQIFKASAGQVLNFGNPGTIFLVKVVEKKSSEQV